jgi:cellulose synthase/poly-beta-1,6-N-acetylglucosamine synthase-like glycosyltransferase
MYLLFSIGAFVAVYSYLLYPLLLLLKRRRPTIADNSTTQDHWPSISVIIPAYNAIELIQKKLDSTLALEYESSLMEVIVVSDGSDDGTDDIVRQYEKRGVRLLKLDGRSGKESAQKFAISKSNGDILVFTDVGTETPPGSLKKLLRVFVDFDVAAASSEDQFLSLDGRPMGEGAYVRYEMWLRRLESARSTLVGLSGSYFAARRTICSNWDTHVPSDFCVAIECARNGQRAVTVPDAYGVYRDVANPANEYQRKVRTIVRGMRGLIQKRDTLNILKYGFFSVQLFSHKIMRWAMPWGVLLVFISTCALAANNTWFQWLLFFELSALVLSLLPTLVPPLRKITLLRLLNYIGTVNFAIAHAAILVMLGRQMVTWEPTKRQAS